MEPQTEVTSSKKSKNQLAASALPGKTWKKKNIEIRKFEEGEEIIGKFLKRRENPDFMDKTTGEIKTLTYLLFEELGADGQPNGEKFQVCENAGLKNCLNANDVNEGDVIRLLHLGKQPIKGTAKTVNTYDLFTY